MVFPPYDDKQFIVEHLFHVKILLEFELTHRLDQADHHDIKLSLAKFWEFQLCAQGIHLGYAKDHPRVLSGEFLDHGRRSPPDIEFRTTYSNLARVGIGQGFDLSYPLSQIVERRFAGAKQDTTIQRGLDAAGVAIEKAQPDR